MVEADYRADRTGLLIVDPYNDFLSPHGKFWQDYREVANEVGLLANMQDIVAAARANGIRIFYVPHHRWEPGDYAQWRHPTSGQIDAAKAEAFAKGTWGGEIHEYYTPEPGDVVALEHWDQDGFAHTDLDLQLKQRGIENIILIGMVANTCVESTARGGMEEGYHITLIRDASAAKSWDAMRAAFEVNGPTFAHAILTTEEMLTALTAEVPMPGE
jgi:nicotinamidase-related amidase